MTAKPPRPCPSSPFDAEMVARHPAAPLVGLFGDPDGRSPGADRADGDEPTDWTTLFARPRDQRPL